MSPREKSAFDCFDRRYLRAMLPGFGVAILGIGIAWLLPRSPLRKFLSLGLGTALLIWILAVTILAIRRLDELQQRIHLIAIAVSFALTAALMAIAMFCQEAGLGWAPTGLHGWTFMMLAWAGTVAILNRRYR